MSETLLAICIGVTIANTFGLFFFYNDCKRGIEQNAEDCTRRWDLDHGIRSEAGKGQ